MSLLEFPNKKSFLQQVSTGRKELVYLVTGTHQDRAAWHYVQVDKARMVHFEHGLKGGALNVGEYGTVLYSGWGEQPPQYIIEELEAQFEAA